MAPSLKKHFRLALGAKLLTGCCCPSFNVVEILIEHVHVVARISWIRVMCWNLRECRPPPNVSPSICCRCLCMPVKNMHVKVPVCFNFFNFHLVCTKYPINIEHIILTNCMLFCFWNCYFLEITSQTWRQKFLNKL